MVVNINIEKITCAGRLKCWKIGRRKIVYARKSIAFHGCLHNPSCRPIAAASVDMARIELRTGLLVYILTTIRQIWSPTSCPAPCHAGSPSAASSVTLHHHHHPHPHQRQTTVSLEQENEYKLQFIASAAYKLYTGANPFRQMLSAIGE